MIEDINGLAIDVFKKAEKYEIIMSATIGKDIYDVKVDLNNIEGLPQAVGYLLLELESAIDNDEEMDEFEEEERDITSKMIDKLPIMGGSPEWN